MNSTVTTKGQVTIPKAMREHLSIAPGDQVVFEYLNDGRVSIAPARPPRKGGRKVKSRFAAFRGVAKLDMRTDDLMRLLRGYDQDGGDPGFK